MRAWLGFAIAAALGVALNSAGATDPRRSDSAAILASAGPSTTVQLNRDRVRIEHARLRTSVPSACVLVAGDSIPPDYGRRATLAARYRSQSLDPVDIESGRSPPPTLS